MNYAHLMQGHDVVCYEVLTLLAKITASPTPKYGKKL